MKSCVMGSGVNQVGQTHLGNPPESLKIRMFNNLIYQGAPDCNKTVNRIIKNFYIFQNINVVFLYFSELNAFLAGPDF